VSTSDFSHLLHLGAGLYISPEPVLIACDYPRTQLTVPDPSCLGVDRFVLFPHAFSNPLELTDRSSKEDWRRIVNGDGSSVRQLIHLGRD
jgi:hypothetical protein